MMERIIVKDAGVRLDIFLVEHLGNVTRSAVKRWIDAGNVKVNGARVKASYKVKDDDEISIVPPPPLPASAAPENIPLNIIYEDEDIIVVNKPAGMVVHPAAGNTSGTMVNALLNHCKNLSGIGGVARPGIVHRLDKGTSGVIVAAKNDRAHEALINQFKERGVKKIYLALIYGAPGLNKGVFNAKIGRHPSDRKKMSTKTKRGRDAITRWEVLERFGRDLALVKIVLETGRTHQIRVHFSAYGMPVVGDTTYGGHKAIRMVTDERYRGVVQRARRPLLHSASLTISRPKDAKTSVFEAPLPDDFKDILEALRAIEP